MKKSTLWYITICAGAVSLVAATILAVMYGRDVFSCARYQVLKLRSAKDKTLSQFLSKSYQADELQQS
ncbi:MAG: hypothetical protein FWD19_05505 [Defluviitaleaceae bacterium]|nr:hypothetical protein [Defluviitaleaceae bacterium]